MAGHNKWSKVKHIKARVDAIKGKVFSKRAHEIATDNIERAIKMGTGVLGGEAIQEVSCSNSMNVFTNFKVADEVRVLLVA